MKLSIELINLYFDRCIVRQSTTPEYQNSKRKIANLSIFNGRRQSEKQEEDKTLNGSKICHCSLGLCSLLSVVNATSHAMENAKPSSVRAHLQPFLSSQRHPKFSQSDRSSQLCMLLVNEHVPIPRSVRHHIHDRLVRIIQRPLLHPRLHVLLHRKIQHLANVVRRADHAATDVHPLVDERESAESRDDVFGRANLDERPRGFEQFQVFGEGHLGRGDGADDEVEGLGVVRCPVLVLVRGDEVVRPEFCGICLLGRGS